MFAKRKLSFRQSCYYCQICPLYILSPPPSTPPPKKKKKKKTCSHAAHDFCASFTDWRRKCNWNIHSNIDALVLFLLTWNKTKSTFGNGFLTNLASPMQLASNQIHTPMRAGPLIMPKYTYSTEQVRWYCDARAALFISLLNFAFVFSFLFYFAASQGFLMNSKWGVEWGRTFSETRTLPSELYCLTSRQTQLVAKQ